jgi:hypothetical protein
MTDNADRFAGKVALVTGAGSGIGAAVAAKLIAQGAAQVVLADLNGVAAKGVAQAWPNASAVAADVASPEEVDGVFADVVDQHGGIDVVVHAAGVDDPVAKQVIADALVAGAAPHVTSDLTDEAWRRVLSINLDGTFFVLRAALRAMAPRVRQRRGGGIVGGVRCAGRVSALLGVEGRRSCTHPVRCEGSNCPWNKGKRRCSRTHRHRHGGANPCRVAWTDERSAGKALRGTGRTGRRRTVPSQRRGSECGRRRRARERRPFHRLTT